MLSRVSDHLYWMARYLERAEHAARVMTVKFETMLDQSHDDAAEGWVRVLAALTNPMANWGVASAMDLAHRLTFERQSSISILSQIRVARDNARQVREQISTEMWERLNKLYLRINDPDAERVWRPSPVPFLAQLEDDLLLFAGTTDSTMRHGEGWMFIQLGRYIERTLLVSRLIDLYVGQLPADVPYQLRPARYGDWVALLKQCTAFEAYCKVYTADVEPQKLVEFLIFDPEFPHSIRFAVDQVQKILSEVGPGAASADRRKAERLAGRLKASLDYGQADELLAGDMDRFLRDIQAQSREIHKTMHAAFISYGVEDLLRA